MAEGCDVPVGAAFAATLPDAEVGATMFAARAETCRRNRPNSAQLPSSVVQLVFEPSQPVAPKKNVNEGGGKLEKKTTRIEVFN